MFPSTSILPIIVSIVWAVMFVPWIVDLSNKKDYLTITLIVIGNLVFFALPILWDEKVIQKLFRKIWKK
jgi:hypothetical protein